MSLVLSKSIVADPCQRNHADGQAKKSKVDKHVVAEEKLLTPHELGYADPSACEEDQEGA